MQTNIRYKICDACKISKPVTQEYFKSDEQNIDGFDSVCIFCRYLCSKQLLYGPGNILYSLSKITNGKYDKQIMDILERMQNNKV